MARGSLGSHYGSFGKGFIDSLLAVMKLSMMMDYYKSREDYMKKRGDWYDRNLPGGVKGQRDRELQRQIGEGTAAPLSGEGGGGGGAIGGSSLAIGQKLQDHLMSEYGFTKEQAAGFVGTLGYESGNFTTMQEKNPVGGGRGGWGYAQWTDSGGANRRSEFEAYAKANNLDPSSYEANVGFMDHELKGKYANAVDEIKKTSTPEEAAKATLVHYEGMPDTPEIRAQGGVPATAAHVASATMWAKALSGGGTQSTGLVADKTAAPLDDPKLADKKPEVNNAINDALNDAKSLLGKNEVPDRAEIKQFLADGGQDLDPHKSAWCAAFVSAALHKHGLPIPDVVRPGTETGPGNVAGDYRTWGSAVDPKSIQAGDVIVANDGSHVGFAEGPVRQGRNGPEVKIIAGNEQDTSGKYQPGSYTMKTGRVIQRAQVGQVGERWVPLTNYSARRAVPGTTADGRTADVSPSASDSEKVVAAKQAFTPYQVAGPMEALTEGEAQRARADLEAHRVSPATQAEAGGREPPVAPPRMAAAQRGDAPPPPRPGEKVGAIPPGPRVAAQDDRFQPPYESGFPQPYYEEGGPETVGKTTGRDWRETDQPTLPPVQGRERGPELAGQRGWTPGDQPVLPPVQGRERGPETVGQPTPRTWQEGDQPPLPPVQGRERGPELAGQRMWTPEDQPVLPPVQGRERGPELAGKLTPTATPIGGGEGMKTDPLGYTSTPASDAPAPAAQPVSATRPAIAPTPRVSQPATDPRYITTERPNLPANAYGGRGGGGAPMMGMLDLSHLWGANPPLSQRGGGGAPPAPVSPAQGEILSTGSPTPYPGPTLNPSGNIVLTAGQGAQGGQSVPAPMPPVRPPDMDDAAAGIAMGSRKGGPIQRFARGGIPQRPMVRYAAAGPVSSQYPSYNMTQPLPTTGLSGNLLAADQFMTGLPGMQSVDFSQPQGAYYDDYGPGSIQGAGGMALNADYGMMSPSQLQQYNQMLAGTWVPPAPATPAAPTPAPTPPAPVQPTSTTTVATPTSVTTTDPTSTTTTGTPGVPTSVTAKSYDPNVDQQTGAKFSNTSNTGGTNYSVGSTDLLNQTTPGTISGSRKGGPIGFARGGGIPSRPTMRFQAGGAAPGVQAIIQAMDAPGYVGPTFQGGWSGTPYSQLAPNQQSWATTQQGLLGQALGAGQADYAYHAAGGMNPAGVQDPLQYWNQMTLMPAAVWPTTPSAPTPIAEPAPSSNVSTQAPTNVSTTDPTSTTTTGVPGVPNTITAKSYDPNVDQQTGASFANTSNTGGTNYSVGSTDLLNQTTPGTISGSRKGGPITRRVARFDDGGGVSPSIAGMPPGLSTGGMQGAPPIPPIYFNPATYSAAGAPVGKGVSATSAPTYNAGAIPSLPMMKGGVVRFEDGGDVADTSMSDMQMGMYDRMQDQQDEAEDKRTMAAQTPPTPMSDKDPGWYINPADVAGMGAGATTGDASAAAPTTSIDNNPPPDPTTPQIKDDAGNPSKGLIGAITAGLHWLGDHLGLIGGAQAHPAIATNPETQNNRQQFATYDPNSATYMSERNYTELNDLADPNHQLQDAYHHIAGLEQGYKWALSQGDDATAGRLAASMLHYSVIASQQLSDKAAQALYNGDVHGAIDNLNKASDAIPDGRLVHAMLNSDGTVTIQGKNLNGEVEWQQKGAARTILERATSLGRSGKLQWDALESQAAKYDSTFAEMAKNRQANAIAQGKADQEQAAGEAEGAVLKKMYPPPADQAAPPTAPATPPPALIPVGAPAGGAGGPGVPGPGPAPGPAPNAPAPSPGKSPDTTTAQSASPPPSADQAAVPGAGRHGIPSAPTPSANAPASDAQEAAFLTPEAEAQGHAQIRREISSQYLDPNTGRLPLNQGPQVPVYPPSIDGFSALPVARQNSIMNDYGKAVNDRKTWETSQLKDMNDQIKSRDADYTAQLASRRQALAMGHSDIARADTQRHADEATAQREKDAATRAAQGEVLKATLQEHNLQTAANMAGTAPRSDQEMDAMGKEGYNPYVSMAKAFDPNFATSPTPGADQNNAVTALARLPGMDRNGINAIANAATEGVRWSRNVNPDMVHSAIGNLITDGEFHATANNMDAQGRPIAEHGEITYTVSVADNSGNITDIVLPQRDLQNLVNIRQRYFAEQGRQLGRDIDARGVLGSLGGQQPDYQMPPGWGQGALPPGPQPGPGQFPGP